MVSLAGDTMTEFAGVSFGQTWAMSLHQAAVRLWNGELRRDADADEPQPSPEDEADSEVDLRELRFPTFSYFFILFPTFLLEITNIKKTHTH